MLGAARCCEVRGKTASVKYCSRDRDYRSIRPLMPYIVTFSPLKPCQCQCQFPFPTFRMPTFHFNRGSLIFGFITGPLKVSTRVASETLSLPPTLSLHNPQILESFSESFFKSLQGSKKTLLLPLPFIFPHYFRYS